MAGAANLFPQVGPGALPVVTSGHVARTDEARSLQQMLRDARHLHNEDSAAAGRLAMRHSKRMWKKIRVLILGLTAPESALLILDMDVLRRVIWHVVRSELPVAAADSPAAPWARLVR